MFIKHATDHNRLFKNLTNSAGFQRRLPETRILKLATNNLQRFLEIIPTILKVVY
jgi:hypothetical protein